MTSLTKAKLKSLEKLLRARLAELVAEAEQATKDINSSREQFADPTDQAVVELDRSRLLRFKDRERKLIRKIEKALSRMGDGTYGECESCGADIDYPRLEARPMTEYCIDCATELESEKKRNRLYGGGGSDVSSENVV
jgi:DnaK suppressor protein